MPDSRFNEAVAEFARINAKDPASELVDGVERPRELVQSERLARWVERLAPHASEALRLAARCQHIARFEVPRSSYPEGRIGYLKWRSELGRFHAERAARVLTEVGYDEATIEAVRRIVMKRGITENADTQTMEDALCLAFLEHELLPFSEKHDDEKLVTILAKTWRKMSPEARTLALGLKTEGRALALVQRATSQEAR